MAYLQYDTEVLASTKTAYEKAVTEMEGIKSDMETMVNSVRESWKSDAGDAFFEKYDNEWLKAFEQYKEVLQHMAYNLDIANNKYSEVTQLANKLKL